VQEEAVQELIDGQAHGAPFVHMGRVSPAEADLPVDKQDRSAVRDADATGVGAEIAQGVPWSTEGTFGIDDPVVTEEQPEPCGEAARLCKRCDRPWNSSLP
jgi:hypothetical protein